MICTFISSNTGDQSLINGILIRFCSAMFLLGMSTLSLASSTDVQPTPTKTWELGLGVGAVGGPDYRGSTETRSYVAPIPYFVYRGKFIQSDRDGVRGQFLKTDKYEFTLSLSANISPDSHKNNLRSSLGLSELGSSLEVGPAFNINLTGASLSEGWLLNLPLRAIFAIGGDDSGYIGYQLQPQLVYRQRWEALSFTYRTSVSYASEDYHAYYYNIDEEFATGNFPRYQAKAGYSGWANQLSLARQFGDWRAAIFVRHDYLEGTTFVDSPLIQTRSSTRGGLAIIWVMK
jgi:outer membrane scaffolding protein for murein synthesis (MipA/OmpV family)